MLEVTKINSFYGELQVLRDVSLVVNEGEFVAVFGANGHGKSSLLKTICGLVKPASGQVKFNGQRIDSLPVHKIVEMGVVYVPEERHLFPEMTVLENLKLGAYNKHARRRETEHFNLVFELFPRLAERKNQLASTLSGGEAQMLAIARGIMSSPKFLAIDEPSLGIAPKIVSEIFSKIASINKNGIGILLVEQNVTKAAELVDRIYLVEEGQIVFQGTKEDVLNNDFARDIMFGNSRTAV